MVEMPCPVVALMAYPSDLWELSLRANSVAMVGLLVKDILTGNG